MAYTIQILQGDQVFSSDGDKEVAYSATRSYCRSLALPY
jgi:hypothetical protein